jgi:hypothetical protein
LSKARGVRGISEQLVVITNLERIQSEERVPLGELVQVEQKLLGANIVNWLAKTLWVLLAFERFDEISVATETIRNGEVGLQDASEHLLVELLLKILGGLQNCIGVSIFRFEVSDDFRALFVTEPGVVVDAAVAVENVLHGFAPGHGRRRRRSG